MSSIRWPFLKSPRFLPQIGSAISRRAGRWARNRQGKDPGRVTLTARRTYILPTGIGAIYALMAFAMLLGSMNYNNNLSFLLTFLLIGLGFVAMHQCQRNLVGLNVHFAGVNPVFAGGTAEFRISLHNSSRATRYRLRVTASGDRGQAVDLAPGESQVVAVLVPAHQRGRLPLERFSVRSLFPFDLFRSWAWLHMGPEGLVYPEPAGKVPSPPASLQALGHRQHDARGEEDFAGLRRFNIGDSPRHVAWKAYARNGQLLSKRFAGADTSSQWFDFSSAGNGDTEQRLSVLTRWIVDADRAGEDYGLRLPGVEIAPGHGEAHRAGCLEALALFGLDS